MFSGGIGSMEAEHVSKEPPEPGMSHRPFPAAPASDAPSAAGGELRGHSLGWLFISRLVALRPVQVSKAGQGFLPGGCWVCVASVRALVSSLAVGEGHPCLFSACRAPGAFLSACPVQGGKHLVGPIVCCSQDKNQVAFLEEVTHSRGSEKVEKVTQ